jgi:hypothetical protein
MSKNVTSKESQLNRSIKVTLFSKTLQIDLIYFCLIFLYICLVFIHLKQIYIFLNLPKLGDMKDYFMWYEKIRTEPFFQIHYNEHNLLYSFYQFPFAFFNIKFENFALFQHCLIYILFSIPFLFKLDNKYKTQNLSLLIVLVGCVFTPESFSHFIRQNLAQAFFFCGFMTTHKRNQSILFLISIMIHYTFFFFVFVYYFLSFFIELKHPSKKQSLFAVIFILSLFAITSKFTTLNIFHYFYLYNTHGYEFMNIGTLLFWVFAMIMMLAPLRMRGFTTFYLDNKNANIARGLIGIWFLLWIIFLNTYSASLRIYQFHLFILPLYLLASLKNPPSDKTLFLFVTITLFWNIF